MWGICYRSAGHYLAGKLLYSGGDLDVCEGFAIGVPGFGVCIDRPQYNDYNSHF